MTATLTLSSKLSPFPYSALAAAAYTEKATITFDEAVTTPILELDGSKITDEEEIVHALTKSAQLSGGSEKSTSFFALAKSLPGITTFSDLVSGLDNLDDHLTYRTYLVGHDVTAADLMLWGALKGSSKIAGLLKNNQHPHLLRWFTHIELFDSIQAAAANLTAAKATKARTNKTAAGFALGLQNAKEGEVVTRFPPEPSGYLHIGHAKAAMLNHYFAKMYKGKLIIRFDDTNPSKEKTEFEDSILEDLRLMDVHGDVVTHTSDYFDTLYDLALKMIQAGNAYADNTLQAQMREERMHGIASVHRDDSIEDNLKHFAEMKTGSEEGQQWCLRAKLSVDSPNKALRDPVIYRCNILPHHRTGTQWKVYPTYDFACPVVDSIEGVTHALRTNEYRDRNPQYQWMIKTLGLRKVNIWDFSRLNFIYTLLSKRKLHWFVDQGLVRGWDDPRFPTIRGIRRRGLTVEALAQFMLLQGPSQAVLSLEWDTIWALNKKIIDPVAPRHWALLKNNIVTVRINGGPESPEVKSHPLHKKNPGVGEKQTIYTSTIFIEQEDALSFEDNEEITLMDWGNAIVRLPSPAPTAGEPIKSLIMDLHLSGDFRKTKKKITWLADPMSFPSEEYAKHAPIDVTLLDYDYLITKKKLEEGDDVKDFVTPTTEFREEAVADANVLNLKKGDIMQFERKGYYILDQTKEDGGKLEFIKIPDGKAASLASKAGVSTPAGSAATPTPRAPTNKNEASATTSSSKMQLPTTMYEVEEVYGKDLKPATDTQMYKVDSPYGL